MLADLVLIRSRIILSFTCIFNYLRGQVLLGLIAVAHAGFQRRHDLFRLLLDPSHFLAYVLPKRFPIVQKIFIVIIPQQS